MICALRHCVYVVYKYIDNKPFSSFQDQCSFILKAVTEKKTVAQICGWYLIYTFCIYTKCIPFCVDILFLSYNIYSSMIPNGEKKYGNEYCIVHYTFILF